MKIKNKCISYRYKCDLITMSSLGNPNTLRREKINNILYGNLYMYLLYNVSFINEYKQNMISKWKFYSYKNV